MRVKREEFLRMLASVECGLSKRDFVEQSSCVVFDEGWACTFNDEICCRTKTGFPDSFKGAVYAEPLKRVLENLTDDEVEISADNGELLVRGKRKKTGIRMEAQIVLPIDEVEVPVKGTWKDLPKEFIEGVKKVKEVTGTNDEEFMTVCVHVHPNWVEACDRKQTTRYEVDSGVTRSFLVRAQSIAQMIPLDMTRIGETDNWVHFRNSSIIFSCRRHLEEYPTDKLTELLKFRGEKAILPQGGVEAANLASIFSGDDKKNDKVLVRLTDGHMFVEGQGARGWAEADMDMAYHGPVVEFHIQPQMLIDLIRDNKECEIGPGKLIVFGERWKYMTILDIPEDKKESKKPVAVQEDGDR